MPRGPRHEGPPLVIWSKDRRLRRAWEKAYRETFATEVCSRWSARDRACLDAIIRRWHPSYRDLLDFLDFVVRRWRLITRTRFAWMKKNPPPPMPEIRFLAAFADKFIQEWCCHLEEEKKWDPKYDRVRGLVRSGITIEEAWRAVGEEDAVAKHRKEFRKNKRALAEKERELAMREKILERGPAWSADNPHPRAVQPKPKPPSAADLERMIRQSQGQSTNPLPGAKPAPGLKHQNKQKDQ